MKIDFFKKATITDLSNKTIKAIWREFACQSQQADVCFVDNTKFLLKNWGVKENMFTCKFTENDLNDFVINFNNLCEVQITGPSHWVLIEEHNKSRYQTEIRFYNLKPVVPISLPKGWKEYCEGDTVPEKYAFVDVIYNDGTTDSCMRPDEITWTSFSVKGWKPCDE